MLLTTSNGEKIAQLAFDFELCLSFLVGAFISFLLFDVAKKVSYELDLFLAFLLEAELNNSISMFFQT